MQRGASSGSRAKNRLDSFTLVELLVVIAVIGILVALTLAAASGVMATSARNRARAEIVGLSTALDGYKTDNGVYPVANTTAGSGSSLTGPPGGNYTLDPSASGGTYQIASQALYQALSGKTNFADNPVAGAKSYFVFKATQLGNSKALAGSSYSATSSTFVQDPWGYAYGYSTGDGNIGAVAQVLYPFNGSGFFDLWSTGGTTAATTSNPNPTNTWIVNWK